MDITCGNRDTWDIFSYHTSYMRFWTCVFLLEYLQCNLDWECWLSVLLCYFLFKQMGYACLHHSIATGALLEMLWKVETQFTLVATYVYQS